MKQGAAKKTGSDSPARRGRRVNWFEKLVFFGVMLFAFAAFVYAFMENGAPSLRVIISMLSVAIPAILLIRNGMIFGVLLGNSMQYIRQEPRTVEQKSALIGLAKREVAWYAGAVFSLLFFYRWTPFAGHVDVFFILAVAVPLSLTFIFALWIRLADIFHWR